MPIARLSATVHDGVNGNALILRLPAVVDNERKATEDVAPNLRLFDDTPARRSSDQGSDRGLDRRNEAVRHSRRGFVEVVVGGLRILEKRLGMKTIAGGHQLAARAE